MARDESKAEAIIELLMATESTPWYAAIAFRVIGGESGELVQQGHRYIGGNGDDIRREKDVWIEIDQLAAGKYFVVVNARQEQPRLGSSTRIQATDMNGGELLEVSLTCLAATGPKAGISITAVDKEEAWHTLSQWYNQRMSLATQVPYIVGLNGAPPRLARWSYCTFHTMIAAGREDDTPTWACWSDEKERVLVLRISNPSKRIAVREVVTHISPSVACSMIIPQLRLDNRGRQFKVFDPGRNR
jgi:hypothetical protein